jgi:GNAT superfamily N-acetyltransferase
VLRLMLILSCLCLWEPLLNDDSIFRFAHETDVDALQSLADGLYASDPNTTNIRPDLRLTWSELNARPEKGRVIVFENEGELIGYCIAIFFWSNEYRGNILEIDELFVDENHRSSGIGTRLFTWLEHTLSDCIVGFSLQVANHNKPALKFYRKLGFLPARNEHMIRVLPKQAALSGGSKEMHS